MTEVKYEQGVDGLWGCLECGGYVKDERKHNAWHKWGVQPAPTAASSDTIALSMADLKAEHAGAVNDALEEAKRLVRLRVGGHDENVVYVFNVIEDLDSLKVKP